MWDYLANRTFCCFFLASRGGVAWVTFPSALVDKGFEIQVGANDVNTDNKPDQKRINRVTCTHEIKNTKTFIASPLGGGIYIVQLWYSINQRFRRCD